MHENQPVARLIVADFFLSESCWQNDAELRAIADVIQPSSLWEKIKEMFGKERPLFAELKDLRRNDTEYLYGGDLRAKTAGTPLNTTGNGFDMPWLHHDCLALIRHHYAEDAPIPDLHAVRLLSSLASLGSIRCTLTYSAPPLDLETVVGEMPETGSPFFLRHDTSSPRHFALYLPGHDPRKGHTASLVINHLMFLFMATVKVLYYTIKAAVLAPQVMLDTARDVVYNLLFHLQIKTVMILFTT
jgi:hypothetical protein